MFMSIKPQHVALLQSSQVRNNIILIMILILLFINMVIRNDMDIDTNMDINNYTVTIMYTDIHIN